MTIIASDRRFQLNDNLGVITLTGNADGARLSVTLNSELVLRELISPMETQAQADALTGALVKVASAFAKTSPQAL